MITIIRVITIIFALSGLLGYKHGLGLTIFSLGVLNIVYGADFLKNKQQGKAISSMLVGVCVLLFAVVRLGLKV